MIENLSRILNSCAPSAIAVSGGVDSMTLAVVAGRFANGGANVFHAVSPAVPIRATQRVKAYAQQEGWALTIIDAGEFADPDYLANPVNRCFFCKLDLYGTIASQTDKTILSGTNTDDLGDYRPGLQAASKHRVRHPFVEASMSKNDVRRLARSLGLDDLSELPAAPCLASRVETGIAIDPAELRLIDQVEELVRSTIEIETVRCRRRKDGLVLELDSSALSALSVRNREELSNQIAEITEASEKHAIRFEPYRRGSAFLRGSSD